MKDILNLAQAVAAANATGQLTDGHLLSPAEYRGATVAGNSDNQDRSTPWVLYGVITPRWLSRLSPFSAPAAGRPIVVSVVEGEEGLAFLLVVHHLQAFEHRLLLPLLGESVSAFLRAAQEVPPLLVSGKEGQDLPAIRLDCQTGLWREALALSQSDLGNPVNAMNQLMRIAMQMLNGKRVGRVQPGNPNQTVVSAVPPPEAEAWLEQQLMPTGRGSARH
jgi:hypothetical protein